MNNPVQKKCSICGESFGCGATNPDQPCWCTELPRVEITEGDDCRCPKCLTEIVDREKRESESGTEVAELIEGIDFYLEGSSLVFTALYHLKRGYCCDSGCRHCPYTDVARSVESKL
ncbi:MAG TPA: cysteine-rich CWC family protein [Pyrinomonadaceae bacterium]|nr:cysteine-rich CWC family protein [Pyrinomonadaceae bacterium]